MKYTAEMYRQSISFTMPGRTEEDLQMAEASHMLGQHCRFTIRADLREAGAKTEPPMRIFAGPRGAMQEYGHPELPLDALLPGEAEWLAARAAERTPGGQPPSGR